MNRQRSHRSNKRQQRRRGNSSSWCSVKSCILCGMLLFGIIACISFIVLINMIQQQQNNSIDPSGSRSSMSSVFWENHAKQQQQDDSETRQIRKDVHLTISDNNTQRRKNLNDLLHPATKNYNSIRNELHQQSALQQQKRNLNSAGSVVLADRNTQQQISTNDSIEYIDMRILNEQLQFDNVDGGVWKQGWSIAVPKLLPASVDVEPLEIYVVPHSHCDPGWIQTFDSYFRSQTSRILTSVIHALQADTRRKFIWAEISYFSWWYEIQTPELQNVAKELLRNGQLEFVTGGWVQPDEANTELYAMEVQLQEGHDWIRTTFPDLVDANSSKNILPRYGWAIDPFGYSETAAYLWKKYGLEGMLIQRVHYNIKKYLANSKQLEFYWRQTWDDNKVMDTSNTAQELYQHDIFTHVMPFFSYDVPHTCGPDPKVCCQFDFHRTSCPWKIAPQRITDFNVEERAELLLDQYRKKASLYRSNTVLIPLGDDFRYQSSQEAEAQYTNYQRMFDYINEKYNPTVRIQFGTLSEYFDRAKSTFQGNVPVLHGSFFTYADVDEDYWSGYYTSRVFDKALGRRLERALLTAETLGATRVDLQSARRALSLFQHHDGVTGTAKNNVVSDYAKRIHAAILYTHGWIVQYILSQQATFSSLLATVTSNVNKDVYPCYHSWEPREMPSNLCLTETQRQQTDVAAGVAIAYNPLPTPQSCGNVVVQGQEFATVHIPCDNVVPKQSETSIVFDSKSGMMISPVKEQWMNWHVRKGGAYLFVPGNIDEYRGRNLRIEQGGYIVKTNDWERRVVIRPSEVSKSGDIVIDFIYTTNLQISNQEWVARFSVDSIHNDGYLYTDLNGFNFDRHKFRSDMPLQSQVFPMPTYAAVQDTHQRLNVISQHAQGTASLQDGTIDVWLDRRLHQDDNRGLGQGVEDNRITETRLRVILEQHQQQPPRTGGNNGGEAVLEEFDISDLGRRMWDELQHPLELYGTYPNPEDQSRMKPVLENAMQKGMPSNTNAATANF